jgi:hypothetical protein
MQGRFKFEITAVVGLLDQLGIPAAIVKVEDKYRSVRTGRQWKRRRSEKV